MPGKWRSLSKWGPFWWDTITPRSIGSAPATRITPSRRELENRPPMLLLQDVLGARRVIVGIHAFGVGGQIHHVERAVGVHQNLERALYGRSAVVILDAELGAVDRADIRAAPHVVERHMQFEVRQSVAQEHHALARIADVGALRVLLEQLLQGFE